MISIWPAFGNSSDIYKEMLANNYLLLKGEHWETSAKIYDAYDEKAREIYWKYFNQAMGDIDAWWLDGSEPELRSSDDRYVTEI